VTNYDLVCLSHLRWDFVYQRPQHLLSRCAKSHRVFFIEEPVYDAPDEHLDISAKSSGVKVVVPHLAPGTSSQDPDARQRVMIDQLFRDEGVVNFVLWYYTPMAMSFTAGLEPLAVVYDCMDELSAFRGAPKILRDREQELFAVADLVFTGGQSLYEAKRDQHKAVYAFPSSVDTAHFAAARDVAQEPTDQEMIPHPRIGFYGVVDERMDLELLAGVADLRRKYHWVIVGPVVKIDPATLPNAANIHFLGGKSYDELPSYLAGWDVAMMPFALNESTKFISPTKTPEYLAGGKPVVSTAIRDVVRPYERFCLARIANTPNEFVDAVDAAMGEDTVERQHRADQFLLSNSWDKTWEKMDQLLTDTINKIQIDQKEQGNV
jgi:glycosyltransferase involved in cell wall biosynthesis